MSKYVKRCAGPYCNRRVQGLTSFRLVEKGVRAPFCRFCEDQAKAKARYPAKQRKMAELLRAEHALESNLVRVRSQLRKLA